MLKRIFAVALICAVLALAGCAGAPSGSGGAAPSGSPASATQSGVSAPASEPALVDCPILPDDDFGHIYIAIPIDEFNELGFAYGDSVNIEFSNGFALTVPYYSGYYGRVGERMLVAYPGYDHVLLADNCGNPLWETAGVSEDDTATVRLAEAGAFAHVQESFNITYSDDRSDYASDVAFANFRSLTGGSIAPTAVYRSASPIDDKHNRAAYVESLMAEVGIRFVLDLSDSDAEIDASMAEDAGKGVDVSYFGQLRDAGAAVGINLGADYPSTSYAQKLASGLVALSEHDAPYLVHCVEGKDRTGFVCMLLEALAGASYEEMLADYMITYDNYYGITAQTDPARFDTIAHTVFDCMLEHLPGMEGVDVHTADFVEPARAYLRRGGMTDEQIDTLVARITR